jgi:uncharacterized protein GlcG (DUF336 family)
MNGVQIGSIQVAQCKAVSAVNFQRPTKAFSEMVMAGNSQMMMLPGSLPIEGGLPISYKGSLIGGLGISGATSAEDGIIASIGLSKIPN